MVNELKNTLTGTLPEQPSALSTPALQPVPTPKDFNKIGNTTQINEANIRTLQGATRTEGQLTAFQKMMALGTQQAYKDRQAYELTNMRDQFDPTKVSGGVFSSIIGKMTQERTSDASNIYSTHTNAYREVQAEVQKRLQYLQDLREKKRQYMTDYKYGKRSDKRLETGKKDAKSQRKEDKGNFNREYIQALQRVGSDTAYMDFGPQEIRQSIQAMAERGHDYSSIDQALIETGIPTFPGSVASDYLNSIFS